MTAKKPRPSYVSLNQVGNKLKITYGFSVMQTTKREGGKMSCFIPGFEIFFSAIDQDALDKKAMAMTRIFLDNFLEQNNGVKALAKELHKRGFKANEDAYTLKEIFNNRLVSAKFSALNQPVVNGYKNTDNKFSEQNMEVAI